MKSNKHTKKGSKKGLSYALRHIETLRNVEKRLKKLEAPRWFLLPQEPGSHRILGQSDLGASDGLAAALLAGEILFDMADLQLMVEFRLVYHEAPDSCEVQLKSFKIISKSSI